MFELKDLSESYYWNCPDRGIIYVFSTNGQGFYKRLNEERFVPFEWELNESSDVLSCYLIEVDNASFSIRYISSIDNDYLCEIEEKEEKEEVIFIKEDSDLGNSFVGDKGFIDNFRESDVIDKIVMSVFFIVSFLALFLFLNFTTFIDSIGFMYSFIFSLITVLVLSKKIVSLGILVSKKHKKTLEKLFIE